MEDIINSSEILKRYLTYPREELLIMRMYINLELFRIFKRTEEDIKNGKLDFKLVKSCFYENYNYITYMLNTKYDIDTGIATSRNDIKFGDNFKLCKDCELKNCIKTSVINFVHEIDSLNAKSNGAIKYIDVLDYILDRKVPEFKQVPQKAFFSDVPLIDLMHVQVILESEFVDFIKYDEVTGEAEFNVLDVTEKMDNLYYINIIAKFYKRKEPQNILKINVKDKEKIFRREEKSYTNYIYSLAAYYKYLIEIDKIDIIATLREMLNGYNIYDGIKIRSHYFIHRYFEKVEKLPYSRESKNKILDIFNYILNYSYKTVPYIPMNIVIYSNDRESVENIGNIIGDFMWYFGYLPDNMRNYHEFMNNIVLDKYSINKLFYTKDGNDIRKKVGVLYLHNFENILYTEKINQNLILNILTDELSKNNNSICTIIYGEKESLTKILGEYPKLDNLLLNIKLDIDELNIEKIYQILIDKLDKTETISEDVSKRIFNYIKANYHQSEVKNMEYVNKLYNTIILNKNSRFNVQKENELRIEDIPEAYNVRNLPEILKELNSLVGLDGIKNQINDLVALLKFNQKANIDMSKFNLHMIFTGNPGTGKTTVARLISDILYNLGYIEKNKFVEVSAKDLIANYVGQTAGKTFGILKSAFGGVLFIDEAYSITDSKGGYGDESIATILKTMEDYRDKLVIIFAGYKNEMDRFINSNPGLVSRIGYKIDFADYTAEELMQIFLNLLEKNSMKIKDEAKARLEDIIKESLKVDNFGNARYINNMYQKVLVSHAKNIEIKGEADLYLINEDDIEDTLIIKDGESKRSIGFITE
ncbi:MAG: AAA family ATPase [Clostridia bacterium]|nr:AAA family ATPase [Clostridia bacterium]